MTATTPPRANVDHDSGLRYLAETSALGPAPSRRALVRGAAWTVPAITLAATAPAYAASGPTCTPAYGKRPNAQRPDRWDFIAYPGCTANGKPVTPTTVYINDVVATVRTDTRGRTYYDLRRQPHSYTFRLRIVVAGVVTFNAVVDVRNSQLPA